MNEPKADKFIKRQGTTDKGKDYEDLAVAQFVLRLLSHKEIQNFKISSNDENFGAFDDVVVEIEKQDNEETFALQLKHVNRGKTLTLKALSEESGNYSIKKYFKSYQEFKNNARDYKLVLVTNAKFAQDGTKLEFVDDGEKMILKSVKCEANPLINMSQKFNTCYRFELLEDNPSRFLQDYKEFFENFFLYPNQENVDQVKTNVMREFQEKFSCKSSVAEQYLQFVSEWSMLEGVKNKLSKEMMQKLIALQLLSPFVHPFDFGPITYNMQLLQEAISIFDVTIFDEVLVNDVAKIWTDVQIQLKDLNQINNLCKQYQITPNHINDCSDLTNMDLTKLLWLTGKCPLIILSEDCSVFRAIELCHQKFILFGTQIKQHENFSIFEKLSNLKGHSKNFEKILKNFTCSLQEKPDIFLEELLQCRGVEEIVTTNQLLEMAKGSCLIGGNKEILSVPYITRVLTENVVSLKFLENVADGTSVIISHFREEHLIDKKLNRVEIIDIDDFNPNRQNNDGFTHSDFTGISRIPEMSKIKLYVTKEESPTNICQNVNFLRRIYQFKMLDDGNLQWIRNIDGVNDLHPYFVDGYFVTESALSSVISANNINIIEGDPGMGKSSLLRSLKNNFPSKFWTIMFTAQEITSLFSDNKQVDIDHLADYVLNKKSSGYKTFDKLLLKRLLDKGKVIFLWDALDEVSDDQVNAVTNLILQLSAKSVMQWITCRYHLRKTLEKKFGVFSKTLTEFDSGQQKLYLEKRLLSHFSEENVVDITTKIGENVAENNNFAIFGVPIQIFMFTDLFIKNPEKYMNLLEGSFSVTNLYHYFIEESFNVYFIQKANVSPSNHLLESALELERKTRTENYEKISLLALFGEKIGVIGNLECVDFLEEIKEEGDSCGFILEVLGSGRVIFAQNSYADYFAASYFFKNMDIIPEVQELLFNMKYTNVRFFLDLLLAKDCPLHIAVLHKNFEALKKYQNQLNSKDSGGRTALHLISSWGVRYPVLKVTKNSGSHIIDDTSEDDYTIKAESSIYIKILIYLLQSCDPLEKDYLFQLSAKRYAEKLNCLVTLIIMKKHQKIFLSNENSLTSNILYFSVKFGDAAVLRLFEEMKYVVTKTGGRSLLHMSVIMNKLDCVKALLSVEEYHKKIDSLDHFSSTNPLILACWYGYEDIVKLLLQYGANVNVSNSKRLTPLHLAALNGNYKILENLLRYKACVDSLDNEKTTPLHFACDANYEDIVECLLKNGANSNLMTAKGITSLCIAANKKNYKTAKILLDFGADVNISAADGRTPLHLASYNDCEEIVELLIKRNANVNAMEKNNYYTPLHAAAVHGHYQVVELLLKSEVKIDSVDKDNITPLYLACQNGHEEVVKLLLFHGADADIYTKFGVTPLSVACNKGHYGIVDQLVTFGADNNFPTNEGYTPLYVACSRGDERIVDRLLTSGVNVNIADRRGWRPLHVACFNGMLKIVEKLITHKANLNSKVPSGETPLHIAVDKRQEEIVRLLIRNGADIETSVKFGWKSIHIACSQGFEEIVMVLIESGAKIDSQALAVAKSLNYNNIVQMLKNEVLSRKYRNNSGSCSTFYKRLGTTDKGKGYEDLTVARLAFELLIDNQIKNFKISSNDGNFGAFDDVVLEIENTKNTVNKYALQLKHVNKDKPLNPKALTEETGNYSLKKYFKSYQQCKKTTVGYELVLITNSKFDISGDMKIQLTDDEIFDVEVLMCGAVPLLNTSQEVSHCFKFRLIENAGMNLSKKLEEYKYFFGCFSLYTNQVNAEQLKVNIVKALKLKFFCDDFVAEKYFHFVSEWSIREGTKEKLEKDMMQKVITLHVLSSFIHPLSFGHTTDDVKLLREAISLFDVSLFELRHLELVKKLWGDAKTEMSDVKLINLLRKMYQIRPDNISDIKVLSDEECSKFLWLIDKSPLVITENESVLSILELGVQRKFVVLGEGKFVEQEKLTVFRRLSDLEHHSTIFKNILGNFRCNLQERYECNLKEIIDDDAKIQDIVTTNELLEMVESAYLIGEKKDILPVEYIPRTLLRNVVSIECLKNIDNKVMVLVSNFENHSFFAKFYLIRIQQENWTKIHKYLSHEKIIFFCEEELTEEEFNEISSTEENVQVVHFEMLKDGNFELIRKKNEPLIPTQHYLENYVLEESCLYGLQPVNNINVVTGGPGIGKTLFLKSLKNNLFLNYWIIPFSAQEVSLFYSQHSCKEEKFINFIVHSKYSKLNIFEKEYLKLLIEKGRIIYFWDALDEVADDALKKILPLIRNLSKKSVMQWITCRHYLKESLEFTFGVFSQRIVQLTEEQQTVYIRQRFGNFTTESNIGEILKYKERFFPKNISSVLNNPLEVFLLTEMLLINCEKFKEALEGLLSEADLYCYYVRVKFNIYYRQKARVQVMNRVLSRVIQQEMKERIKNYQQAALCCLVETKYLKHWCVQCDDFLKEIQSNNDRFGFIAEIRKDRPIFVHRSYAEYFVATFLHQRYKTLWRFEEFIFDRKYRNIRYFFDLLLGKDNLMYIAVLHKNLRIIKTWEGQLGIVDNGGRNALHLASSWGAQYPVIKMKKNSNGYVVEDADLDVETDGAEYIQILEYLLTKCNLYDRDNLFNLDSLSYATRCNCLSAVVILRRHQKKDLPHSRWISYVCTPFVNAVTEHYLTIVLYCCVKYGDGNFMHFLDDKDIKFVVSKSDNRSLLHWCVLKENISCLNRLLSISDYKKKINWCDNFDQTCMDIASSLEYDDLVHLLKM